MPLIGFSYEVEILRRHSYKLVSITLAICVIAHLGGTWGALRARECNLWNQFDD